MHNSLSSSDVRARPAPKPVKKVIEPVVAQFRFSLVAQLAPSAHSVELCAYLPLGCIGRVSSRAPSRGCGTSNGSGPGHEANPYPGGTNTNGSAPVSDGTNGFVPVSNCGCAGAETAGGAVGETLGAVEVLPVAAAATGAATSADPSRVTIAAIAPHLSFLFTIFAFLFQGRDNINGGRHGARRHHRCHPK